MAYYDYNALARHKIAFGWIDNRSKIKKPMALALSQNITEYWAAELVNYGVFPKIKTSLTELLESAHSDGSKFIVVSTLGVNYSKRYSFLNELGSFFDTHDDPSSISIIGHILDKKDKFYELHPQTFLINIDWWVSAGRPEFGNEQHQSQELPVVERSHENWHDDYTPHWIKKGQGTTTYTGTRRGWNIIRAAMETGGTIYSFNERLRDSKIFLYPEVTSNTHREYYHVFNALQSYIHFAANTESPLQFNFDNYDFDSFDGAISTGGGISPLLTAYSLNMQPGAKIVITDISPVSLIMQEKIRNRNIDILDYEKQFYDMLHDDLSGSPFVNNLLLASGNINRMQQIISQNIGLQEYYKNVWPHIRLEFELVNFLSPETTGRIWRKFEHCKNVYVNISNVYSYQNTSWLYNLTERLDAEEKLLEQIAKFGPDKYYIKCIRYKNNSWNGIKVSKILENGITRPEELIKEFPWQT